MGMNDLEKLQQKDEESRKRKLSIGLGLSMLALFFSFIFPTPGIIVGAIGAKLSIYGLGTSKYRHARVGIFAGCAAIVLGLIALVLSAYVSSQM